MKIVSSKTIFRGRVFELARVKVRTRGSRTSDRDLVVHGGSVGIVPFVDDRHVLLIRQFRFATGGWLWEIPAGTLEPGELPLACARRELEEETGFVAKKFKRMARFYTCPGICTEKLVLFFAYGLEKRCSRQGDDSDEITARRAFQVDKAVRMIKEGKVTDGKTIIGLLLAQSRIKKKL